MEILWSADALIDLENIRASEAGREHGDPLKVLGMCHYLYDYPARELNPLPDLSFPRRGKPGLRPKTFDLPVPRYPNYIITYVPHAGFAEIVAVRDCRRKPGRRPG